MVKGYKIVFQKFLYPWEIIKLKDSKKLSVQLLVIGDKQILKKFDS